ncbi:acyl-CoA mutase large subunit family protein [Streptomyces tsukubensis]|uniref:acyl-CoA mutase large subunit family protein n=1 Tax=Streptomyces tsukubensis TaxID=83656 RepID=UPI00344C75D5
MTDEHRHTASGIPLAPYYTAPPPGTGHESLGGPGEPPFTRGSYHSTYREFPWTVRPLAGFGTAADTNARLRMLLKEGATAVNTVFDYPTNRGYDSDDPVASADVGLGGVAVDCVEDMLELYEGVDLESVSVSLVLSHPVAAGVILAMYFAAARERGIRLETLSGTLQNDFMMETVVLTAPQILDPGFALRLAVDVVEYCTAEVPRWHPVSFAGYNYREAGADAVLEIALVVANAIATARSMEARGHPFDAYARRLSGFLAAGNDLIEETAKFRAARRVYHRELSRRFPSHDPASTRLRFHVQTSGSTLTARQPLNNVARATVQALAAILGGAQSLHVSAYDEALGIPTPEAALTALRTQQILLQENGLAHSIDPLAGSYLIEHVTDELDARATAILDEIEALGGLVAAVEAGWVHARMLDQAYRTTCLTDTGERPVIGVNCCTMENEPPLKVFSPPPAEERQAHKLADLRARRDHRAVTAALDELTVCVTQGTNTMPALIAAATARATVGECAQVFRTAHGHWRQPLT